MNYEKSLRNTAVPLSLCEKTQKCINPLKVSLSPSHIIHYSLFITHLLLLLLFTPLLAQDFSISAYVDRNRVSEGEIVRLTIEAKGDGFGSLPNPDFPADMPFAVLGSSRGSSTSVSLVNGRMTSQRSETVTFNLRADRTGNLQIPSLTITIDGKAYHTRPIDITVSAGGGQTQQGNQPTQQVQRQQQQQQAPQDGSEMFLRAIVDKTNVTRNEMIIVHYKLYTRSQVQSLQLGGEPTFTGFWKEELYQADRVSWQQEVYDGRQYNTLLVRSIALFPSREGSLSIPTLDMDIDVVVPGRGFFDFGTTRRVRVTSRPINITVNPLPTIEPERNFIGGVGRFQVSSSISDIEGETGNSLTYRIIISGTGNFNQVSAPKMPDVRGLRFMTPEIDDKRNQSSSTFSGTRTFIYPIILQESGVITIPEMTLSWWDTSSRSYQSQTLPERVINVKQSEQQIVSTPGSQQTIRMVGRDIQFIISDLSHRNFKFLYQTFWYWLWLIVLLLSLTAHNFYILETQKQNTDASYLRNRRAMAVMKKYLKAATAYAKANSIEFYDSAYIGLTQFLTDKLNLPRGSTEKTIFETLKERNISEPVITDLKATFDKINLVKFSKSDNTTADINADKDIMMNLINRLMTEFKK